MGVMTMPEVRDGRNDFDFFVGKWVGHNRRLKARLVECTEWEEVEGHSVMHKILNGLGNFDEVTFHREEGQLQGATMRLYNPETCEWAIYWASTLGNSMFPPMVGRFENGVGTFYAFEPQEGRHIYSRFIWSQITANS